MKRILMYIALCAGISLSVGCKKTAPDLKTDTEIDPPQKRNVFNSDPQESLIKDSVFYYTKLFSLWQDNMPPRDLNDLNKLDFIRKNYTQYFERGEDVLDWLVSLTPKNTETGKPIDRYSFLDRKGLVSEEIQDAVATSFGISVFYLQTDPNSDNADLFVRMVDKNSSAAAAGMKRGDQIVSINGDKRVDYSSQSVIDFKTLNQYLNAASLEVKFKKPNGDLIEKNIVNQSYAYNPVLADKIITIGGKNIGYLAFSSFVAIEKYENGAYIKTPMYYTFEQILSAFQRQGVNELVVDLRYNGGGSVLTAEYLADWFVPAANNKELMYTYSMNNYFQKEGWTRPGGEFGPIFFDKKGNLDLKRIYFLVSKSTASASELLINSLKPHMQVYMVGTKAVLNKKEVNEKTYGKPVGFWEWPIVEDENNKENDVYLYASSFKTFNKSGEGDYFNGLEPQAHVWEFSNFLDFGQEGETMLRAAITHIQTGSFVELAMRSAGFVPKNRVLDERIQERGNTRGSMFKFNKETLRLND